MPRKYQNLSIALFLCCAFSSFAQLEADFTVSDSTGCGSLQVSFCDNSDLLNGNFVVSRVWDLSGFTAASSCPGRVFSVPGSYSICLTVTDNAGNIDTECKTDIIQVYELPQVDFIASPTEGCAPLMVEFEDLSTSTSAPIAEWTWGLGGSCNVVVDGTGANQQCVYDIPDSYSVSLTVTDENGCSQTESKTDYITASPKPEIEVSVTGDFACSPPAAVNFINTGPTAGISYEWDFGNNQIYEGKFPPTIFYNDYGIYSITIIATDTSTNCSDILVLEDYVQVGNEVDFSFTPTTGCEDLEVAFTDASPVPADSVIWEFGDGYSSTEANPSHYYNNPGCYYVKLRRFIDGCESQKLNPNCILVEPKPVANYSNDNSIGCSIPHIVNFTSLTTNAVSWHWDFGDNQSSDLANPTHSFEAFGEFPVSLVTTNLQGCKDTVVLNTIKVQEVEASLLNPFLTGCAPLEVNFADNSNSITPIVAWEWEVITPNQVYQSTAAMPNFSIVDTGFFDVKLIVSNTLGCSDTSIFEQVIQVGADPLVNFEATPLIACVEIPIDFTDLSADFAEEWFWDFGDNTFGFEQHPQHLYTDTGYYDITLLVNHNGCNGVLNLENYIHVIDPVAKFTVQKFCNQPFKRKFKDKSIGAETILWDFGIAGTETDSSSLAEPEFIFPDTGMYTVKLTAFNANTGCYHTETKKVYITVPFADFALDTLKGCAPLSIQASDQSEFGDKYYWSGIGANFSDANAANPLVSFNTPGAYTDLQLIIKDINNCRDTMQFQDTIFANGIELDFGANPNGGCRPLDVAFIDASIDLFANITSRTWDFANGLGSSNEDQPNFVFDTVGLFPVGLTITDDWGCTNSLELPELVEVTQPIVNFHSKTYSCTSKCIQFQNSSVGKNINYHWDFGDNQTANIKKPLHCFENEGTYTVCLTVTDAYGCQETLCKENYITIADPVADFSVDVNAGTCPPLNVPFVNLSQNASEFIWDFGNGSSNMESPTQIYNDPGTYQVSLIATSVPGCSDTLIVEDLINLEGPSGSFAISQDTICKGESINFIAASASEYLYVWDFGDGTLDTAGILLKDTISHVYDALGTYMPTLVLTDAQGCQRPITIDQPIYVGGLSLDFAATDTLFCDTNAPITFINLSTASQPIESFEWHFEQGNPALTNAIEPTVSFTGTGKYNAQLIASTALCTDTLLKEDFIRIGPNPIANFELSAAAGCAPLEIDFTDLSTTSEGTIETWVWDFGDGTTDSIANPTHSFDVGENIPISLTVFNDIGCRASHTEEITAYGITALSAGTAPEICIGEAAQLQASINGDTTGVNFYWEASATLSCLDCLNPKANPIETTTYQFFVENEEGCLSTSEVTVVVKPFAIPEISLSNDTSICVDGFVQLYVSGGEDVYAYQWDQNQVGLNCYEACFNPIATPTTPTSYVVTVTNDNGCAAVDSVFVDVLNESQAFAGVDKTICKGATTQLSLSMGTNPQWLVYDGLTCVNCLDPIASPSQTTTYPVEVTTGNGCTIRDSITIYVIPPEAIDAGRDTTVCLGDIISLNGQGAGAVTWFPSSTLDDPNILNPEALPELSTTYKLTLVNGECTLVDSVQIKLLQKIEIFAEELEICQNDAVYLRASGSAANYVWTNLTTGEKLIGENPLVSPKETTSYQVIGNLSSCISDTAIQRVKVNPIPDARLAAVKYYFPGEPVYLDVSLSPVGSFDYQWITPSGLSCTNCPDPVVDPEEAEASLVVQIRNRNTGCILTKQTRLEELNSCPGYLASLPNAFSPDGDGINDELIVQSSGAIEELRSFQVYDRWGNLIFETNKLQKGWDGSYNGQALPNGVYVYFVELVCPIDGSAFYIQGDVSLLR